MTPRRLVENGIVLFGVAAGLAVVLTYGGRTDPLWLVWAALALAVSATAGITFVYGLHRWSETNSIRPVAVGRVLTPVSAIVVAGIIGVNVTDFLPGAAHGNWRNALLLSLAILGGAPTAAVMYGVRNVAYRSLSGSGTGSQLAAILTLRRLLQRLLVVAGWSAALIIFQAGTLIKLERTFTRRSEIDRLSTCW